MLVISALRERLSTSLWFIPGVFAIAALVGAVVIIEIDRQLQSDRAGFYLYGGTAEGARSVLSTIAQSMLTFTALVFTITMLVLQLASSQLSPRVLRTFLSDRGNQIVLGLFVATLVYTLMVLRDVRSGNTDEEFVPALAVWVSFVLLLASIGAFIYYINHMAHAIRASTVIDSIAQDTRVAIDNVYPNNPEEQMPPRTSETDALDSEDEDWVTASVERAGSVLGIDEKAILSAAQAADVFVDVIPRVGAFMAAGETLFRINGRLDDDLERRLRGAFTIGSERTMSQDVAFGFRQLIDIAARALSPGTNDATTATQAIERLHDLLMMLSQRPFPNALRVDDEGVTRVRLNVFDWGDYVHLATDELRLYGAGHVQVVAALARSLQSLAKHAPADRRGVVEHELERLREQVSASEPSRRVELTRAMEAR